MTKELTSKQKKFVEEYLLDFNATQAAIRAGYSEKTARQQGQRLLTKVDVQKSLQKRGNELSKKVGIDHERILTEEKHIAFSDIRGIFDEDGTIIKPNELPEEVSRSISKIEVIDTPMGKKYRYHFWDKGRALDRLEKILNLPVEDKPEGSGRPAVQLNVAIFREARERDEADKS
jgi:phage terminase small subunit